MNQIIVPTDFSDTSKNAANFAAHLSNNISGVELILYTVFETMEYGSDGTPLENHEEDRKVIMELALQNLRDEITPITSVPIRLVVEEDNNFTERLANFVSHHNIPLIVMGITGVSKLEQILIGSNTLKLINRGTAPLMIVPPEARFKDAKNIMLISDFEDVEKTTPLSALKNVLNLFHANLHIVHVEGDQDSETASEIKIQQDFFAMMLSAYNPKFHFLHQLDFVDAINHFAYENEIDLIITISKPHPLIAKLFSASHTKKLAYHSHIPLIAIHS
jgi:nucleotide-binding universal stress UspA family protein